MARLNLPASLDDLKKREGAATISDWAQVLKLDTVVWTALMSNFEAVVKKPFSTPEAISYLRGLSAPAKVRAAEYIWRAPQFVRTPVR